MLLAMPHGESRAEVPSLFSSCRRRQRDDDPRGVEGRSGPSALLGVRTSSARSRSPPWAAGSTTEDSAESGAFSTTRLFGFLLPRSSSADQQAAPAGIVSSLVVVVVPFALSVSLSLSVSVLSEPSSVAAASFCFALPAGASPLLLRLGVTSSPPVSTPPSRVSR